MNTNWLDLTLEQWLDYQQQCHPVAVDLGLKRIRQVAERMQLLSPEPFVITVAGTNGKGSTIALLEAVLLDQGYRVGVHTSPHLRHYNERVRINGTDVSDRNVVPGFLPN